MANTPATPQQGGSSGSSQQQGQQQQGQQQQGQQPGTMPQQGGQAIFRDWASI